MSTKANRLIKNVRNGYSLGWSFTPLNGKSPVLKGWQKRSREKLEEALTWAANGNMGLRTGRAIASYFYTAKGAKSATLAPAVQCR